MLACRLDLFGTRPPVPALYGRNMVVILFFQATPVKWPVPLAEKVLTGIVQGHNRKGDFPFPCIFNGLALLKMPNQAKTRT